MQFKLSSCFATHSVAIAVVLVVCPNLNRPPAFIPPLHPSSINLPALISSSPSSLIPSPCHPSQSHYNIHTVCSKSLQSFLTSLEERTVETSKVSFVFVNVKRKERKGKTRLDSYCNLSGAVNGLVLFVCLLGWGRGSWRNFICLLIIYWILDSSGDIKVDDVFLLASSFFKVVDDVVVAGVFGDCGCGCDEEEGIIGGVW